MMCTAANLPHNKRLPKVTCEEGKLQLHFYCNKTYTGTFKCVPCNLTRFSLMSSSLISLQDRVLFRFR